MGETLVKKEQFFAKSGVVLTGILGVYGCISAIDLFLSIFLAAKLFFVTDGNFGLVGLFYVVHFALLFVGYIISSYISKRYSRVWCIRSAVLIILVTLVLIVFLQDQIDTFYLLFGGLTGIAMGMMWGPVNMFVTQTFGGPRMSAVMTYQNSVSSVIKIIFPFTLGAIIEYASFFLASVIALSISICCIAFTFFLRDNKALNKPLSMRKYYRLIKEKKFTKPVAVLGLTHFLSTQAIVCAPFLTNIMIAQVYGNNFSLGWMLSVFYAASILVMISYKLLKPGRVKNSYFMGSCVLAFLFSLGLLFGVDKTTLIFFNIASIALLMLTRIEVFALSFNIMKLLGHEEYLSESNLLQEFFMMLGRCLAMGIVALVYFIDISLLFSISAVVMMIMAPIACALVFFWYRAYTFAALQEPQPTHPPAETVPQSQE